MNCLLRLFPILLLVLYTTTIYSSSSSFSYTARSFTFSNQSTLLLSGSFHYARSTPAMWPGLFHEMIQDGLNHLEMYVFWNGHVPEEGQVWEWEGRYNLTQFLDIASRYPITITLRLGPYGT